MSATQLNLKDAMYTEYTHESTTDSYHGLLLLSANMQSGRWLPTFHSDILPPISKRLDTEATCRTETTVTKVSRLITLVTAYQIVRYLSSNTAVWNLITMTTWNIRSFLWDDNPSSVQVWQYIFILSVMEIHFPKYPCRTTISLFVTSSNPEFQRYMLTLT